MKRLIAACAVFACAAAIAAAVSACGGGKFSGKCDGARGFANVLLRVRAAARRRFPRGSNPPVAVELLSYDGEAMTSKDDCRV